MNIFRVKSNTFSLPLLFFFFFLMFRQSSKGPEKKIKGVCYFSSSLILFSFVHEEVELQLRSWGEGCTPSAAPRQRTGCCQGAVVLTWGKAPVSRRSLNWPAQDRSQRCHSHLQNREGGNMARAKVESQEQYRLPFWQILLLWKSSGGARESWHYDFCPQE